MKNFKKIFVVYSIVAFTTMQSLSAIQLRDMINVSSVKRSSWTSPATGKHYFYSGSYQFTFNAKNDYQPWINGSPPSYQAGCGGISIKGMFLSILNFNEIKDQLSNAGAALAWGVMLSLIASVPILGQVFTELQKWSRTLQKLLQNACKIGQNIGKKAWGDAPVGNMLHGFLADSGIEDVYNNMMGGIDKQHKNFDRWVDSLTGGSGIGKCNRLSGEAKIKCETKLNSTTAEKAKDVRYTDVTSLLIGTKKLKKNPTNTIFVGRLSALLNSGKIGGYQLIDSSERDYLKSVILLSRVIFGDFAINKESLRDIFSLTNCDTLPDNGTCSIIKDKLKADLKARAAGYVKIKADNKKISYSYIKPILTSKDAAKALLYGFKKEHNNKACEDGYCRIQDNKVIFIDLGIANTTDGSTPVRLLGNIAPDGAYNNSLKVEWDGAIMESMKQIKYIVKNKGGDTNSTIGFFEGQTIRAENRNFPLLIPGIGKYISLIVALEKDNGKHENYFTASLKEMLAKYNAYLFSLSLIEHIKGKVKEGMSKDGISQADINQLKLILENISRTTEVIKKELDKTMDIVKLNKTINEIFTQIDKERRMRISNTLR